ncbi:hypothetical protein ACE10Z_14745 [Bradyrhizobium sp. Pha-3]|uniref:hypothetical protein n=1 Tax=Bradyrhizobium sp. Pha-3 TaxID=208375 RepID=UPI0035D4703B
MRKISIALLAGTGVLFANSAMAAGVLSNDATYFGMNQPSVEQVRLVCDDSGRCYRSRGSRRVVIQRDYSDSYNYAPREEYIERRGYYYDQPRPGFGSSAPGVSIGVGVGNDRW